MVQVTLEKCGQLEADLAHYHGVCAEQSEMETMHPLAIGDMAVRKHWHSKLAQKPCMLSHVSDHIMTYRLLCLAFYPSYMMQDTPCCV